jgi:Fe-S cluster assembly protein SufB
MSIAVNKYPEIVKKYFSKCIPLSDHKFAALHYAVWS